VCLGDHFEKVPVWRTKGCAELGLTGVILVSTPWERSQDKETSREDLTGVLRLLSPTEVVVEVE